MNKQGYTNFYNKKWFVKDNFLTMISYYIKKNVHNKNMKATANILPKSSNFPSDFHIYLENVMILRVKFLHIHRCILIFDQNLTEQYKNTETQTC